MASKVLIVEDDPTLLSVLEYNIGRDGHQVRTAADGLLALEQVKAEPPDLIILDIMLPNLDGLEVCRILRKDANIPIIMLTARTGEIDRVVGLELGADDYVTKPFSMRELMARVRAVLRRWEPARNEVQSPEDEAAAHLLRVGDLEIDLAEHRVAIQRSPVVLSRKEFDLLAYLVRNRGRVFSREHLLEKVWGYDYEGDSRTVDVHIRWLRQKVEADAAQPRRIVTVRGVGYKYEE